MHSLVASNKIQMDDLTLVIAPVVVGPVPAQFTRNGRLDSRNLTPFTCNGFTATPPVYADQSHPHSFSARSIQPHPSSTAREPHPQPCSSSITKDHLPQQPPAKKSNNIATGYNNILLNKLNYQKSSLGLLLCVSGIWIT